jgi:hypothetical protein
MVVMMLLKSPCVFSSIIYEKTSSGVRPALPMGVAPEVIAEFFGYRLKKIDILVPYISSCDIF